MKPYSFIYPCPYCQKSLQSQNIDTAKTLFCPACQGVFKAPTPPARPIGGWLTFYGVHLLLGYASLLVFFMASFFIVGWLGSHVLLLVFFPFISIYSVYVYGMHKQRKWFIPAAIVWHSIWSILGAIFVHPLFVFGFVWILYFLRSQRVKETFTT
jgi:hypothetical protein